MNTALESIVPDPLAHEATEPSSLGELVAFVLVGGAGALGFVVLSSLAMNVGGNAPRWLVSTLCYAFLIVPVYLLHRRFTFRSEAPHLHALPRYVGVQVLGLALALLFSYVAYHLVAVPTPAAALLVIGLTSVVNFVVLKVWAFAVPGSRAAAMPKALLNAVHGGMVFGRRVRVLSEQLAEAIPPGRGTVLDLGCGDGSVAAALMALRPELAVEGVDVLIRPETHIPVSRFDGHTLPFADGAFDYVTIVDVLHHTDDPARVLAEACRVARRGVVIKDHLLEGFAAGPTLRLMDWVGNRGHDVVLPYNYLSAQRWDAVFGEAGCRVVTRRASLRLYPAPASLLFDRQLHFVALVAPPQAVAA